MVFRKSRWVNSGDFMIVESRKPRGRFPLLGFTECKKEREENGKGVVKNREGGEKRGVGEEGEG